MKRFFTSILLAAVAVLSGCATADYQAYAAAHEATQTTRNRALMEIAKSGDSSAKVAAVMALAFGSQQTAMQAPRDPWDRALQALSIIAPLGVQAYSIKSQTELGIVHSNNALATSKDANATMLGFGSLINAPVVVEQPPPVIVDQPPPIIVTQPPPIIVDPVIVQPGVIQVPAPALAQ